MARPTVLLAALGVASALVAVPAISGASVLHPAVVSDNPVNNTPVLVDNSLGGPALHVDAIAQAGATVYAGGFFDTVADSALNGGQVFDRSNVMALDADTREVSDTFAPVVDGNVWAIEATLDAVYIGGTFTTVNGVSRPALAKLDPITGALDPAFDARFTGGRIDEIEMLNGRLIVAGKNGRKLIALDPLTGRDTDYIQLDIADAIPLARGGVTIFDFAINPAGTQLVATGNFQTVDGMPRTRLFVANLDPQAVTDGATVDDWYYEPFAQDCASTNPRRIAYLQGVDYSPDGTHFAVTATGQIVDSAQDRNVTVCDAVGYFDVTAPDDSPAAREWINYTGGDSVWSTAVTGAAVYAQGHFSWLDNTRGFASTCPTADLSVCDARKGVGAIDPESGFALPWDPNKPARLGGKDFLATGDGLWIGSDSRKINGENRYGLALMPLTSAGS